MVKLFREVRRALKPTGTLWLNLGDSYYGGGWKGSQTDLSGTKQYSNTDDCHSEGHSRDNFLSTHASR